MALRRCPPSCWSTLTPSVKARVPARAPCCHGNRRGAAGAGCFLPSDDTPHTSLLAHLWPPPPLTDLGKAAKLLGISRLEVDVYRRPHRLPAQPYSRATALAAGCATALVPLVRRLARHAGTPLVAGAAVPPSSPLDLSMCRALAPQLRGLQAALAACCDALAGVVEQQQPFSGTLACLAELEAAWAALDAAALAAVAAAGSTRAAMIFRMIRGHLFLVASKVRSWWHCTVVP